MHTYFMFGKYTTEGIKRISANRTKKAEQLIRRAGGRLVSIHALLGTADLVFVARFDDVEDVMRASLALTKVTGIAFSSSPAVPVEDFDKLAS